MTRDRLAAFAACHREYMRIIALYDAAFQRWFTGQGKTRACDVSRLFNRANYVSAWRYKLWNQAEKEIGQDPYDALGIPHNERYY